MKTRVDFLIIGTERPTKTDPGTLPYVADMAIYSKMVSSARTRWGQHVWPAGDERSAIRVNCAPDDPTLAEILKLLKKAGWTPYYGCEVPEELRKTHFQMRLFREYSQRDYDEAEYLWLRRWGSDPITGFAGRRGERWIGKVSCVGKTSGRRWQHRFGWVDGGFNYFVRSEVRAKLDAAGLKGLRFHPLEWDEPRRATADYWEIDTTFTMPPCLSPTIKLVSTTLLDGTKEYMTTYDDGCRCPVELAFRRSQVDELGEFDLAWTRESLKWTRPNVGDHWLVVSQRFRQTVRKLRLRHVSFGLVRFVD